MYYEALRRRVGYFKNHEGGKKMMCDVIQELVEKAEKRAEEKGKNLEWNKVKREEKNKDV